MNKTEFGFSDYADWLLQVPLILRTTEDKTADTKDLTVNEVYADMLMENTDIRHALSMVFPAVRLKDYIEIRMADSMPMAGIAAYCALTEVFFSSEELITYYLNRYPAGPEDILAAEDSLIENGYEGKLYGVSAAEFVKELLVSVWQRSDDRQKEHLGYFVRMMKNRKTMAQIMKHALEITG